MQKIIDQLLQSLEELITLHRALLEIEQSKVSVILDQDWKELEQLLGTSRKILDNIETAEKQRLRIVERLCGRAEAHLSEVEKTAPETQRARLKSSGARLAELITMQKGVSRNVESLLRSSLEIVNFTLSLFMDGERQGKIYSVDGQDRGSGGKSSPLVFDIKA
jgi:nucleotidyltransferase/DNA polymerase involved in DNA repair